MPTQIKGLTNKDWYFPAKEPKVEKKQEIDEKYKQKEKKNRDGK